MSQYNRGNKGRGGFRGGYPQQSPARPLVKASLKGPITLITNNFKISNKNHGVIYTYKVDFLETGPKEMTGSRGGGDAATNIEEETKSNTTGVSFGDGAGLETFQKFKIMNASAAQLKQIFMQYVFVGTNLYSTSQYSEQVTIETNKPFFNHYYTIVIERVSEFLIDDLNSMRME